jgi:uncharacterized protein YndB with AHSA1/START domain
MNFGDVQADAGGEPIVIECYLRAPTTKVFEAWTDPQIIMKWFGHAPNSLHSATIDLRPGGAWQFVTSKDDEKTVGFEGEYLDIQPGERLVFTWARVITYASGERDATLQAEVQVSFIARGGGTDVRLTHTVKQAQDWHLRIGDGWRQAFKALDVLFTRPESRQ